MTVVPWESRTIVRATDARGTAAAISFVLEENHMIRWLTFGAIMFMGLSGGPVRAQVGCPSPRDGLVPGIAVQKDLTAFLTQAVPVFLSDRGSIGLQPSTQTGACVYYGSSLISLQQPELCENAIEAASPYRELALSATNLRGDLAMQYLSTSNKAGTLLRDVSGNETRFCESSAEQCVAGGNAVINNGRQIADVSSDPGSGAATLRRIDGKRSTCSGDTGRSCETTADCTGVGSCLLRPAPGFALPAATAGVAQFSTIKAIRSDGTVYLGATLPSFDSVVVRASLPRQDVAVATPDFEVYPLGPGESLVHIAPDGGLLTQRVVGNVTELLRYSGPSDAIGQVLARATSDPTVPLVDAPFSSLGRAEIVTCGALLEGRVRGVCRGGSPRDRLLCDPSAFPSDCGNTGFCAANTYGIFSSWGGTSVEAYVLQNEIVDGSPISGLTLSDVNGSGQFAFLANLSDGRRLLMLGGEGSLVVTGPSECTGATCRYLCEAEDTGPFAPLCLRDPAPATAFDYEVELGNPAFAAFEIAEPMPQGDESFELVVNGSTYPLTVGQRFDFTALDENGVTAFRLQGIDPAETLPTEGDPGFLWGATFTEPGEATITATALVPEPAPSALATAAIAVLAGLARRREGARSESVRARRNPLADHTRACAAAALGGRTATRSAR